MSDPLETNNVFVIVPSPRRLSWRWYPFKPFNQGLWIFLGLNVFSISFVITITLNYIQVKENFWRVFGYIWRAILAQSFPFPYKSRQKLFLLSFMLPVVLGFVTTIWYNTILGSFLSTKLLQTPIETIDDLRKSKFRIIDDAYSNGTLYLNQDYQANQDLLLVLGDKIAARLIDSLDRHYAYIEDSTHWTYFTVPKMIFFDDPRFRKMKLNLGVSFSRIYLNYSSPFKNELNRFIHLTKDVGLYNHWCERVFIENLKYKFSTFEPEPKEPIFHQLRVEYFENVFMTWGHILVIATVTFLLEVLTHFLKNKFDLFNF